MWRDTIKKIAAYATALGVFSLLVVLTIQSIHANLRLSHNNIGISADLPYKEKRAASASRHSAVRIISMSIDGSGLSSMSGTYLTALGRHYVLTVMHGLAGPCELTKVLVEDTYYGCIKYVTVDTVHDYAIMEVETIPTRTPVSIILDTPSLRRSTHSELSVLSNVYYTGFPNTMGPFTVRGHVMGSDAFGSKNLYILSYAWMGASGSGVFNEDSKLIGYVIALDVGRTEYGVQVLENVVMVGRSSNIDWSPLFKEFYE